MKDGCCCGATKSNPCVCMKKGITKCSKSEPKCPCYAEKDRKSFEKAWSVVKNDDTKLARWLRNTANAGTPYDDYDWDGKVLTVYSGDDVERYTLADLKEAGAL